MWRDIFFTGKLQVVFLRRRFLFGLWQKLIFGVVFSEKANILWDGFEWFMTGKLKTTLTGRCKMDREH
jgi:hypothetical protein